MLQDYKSSTKIKKSIDIYYILFITALESQDEYPNQYKVKYNFNDLVGVHQSFAQSELDNTAPNIVLSSSNGKTFGLG